MLILAAIHGSYPDSDRTEAALDPIRIHLGPMPGMLGNILSDLLGSEPDIMIVGRSTNRNDCLADARAAAASVIVTREAVGDGSDCLGLILAEPPLGLLEVSHDGQSAAGMSLVREPVQLNDGGPSGLSEAIRRIAAQLAIRPCAADHDAPGHRDITG